MVHCPTKSVENRIASLLWCSGEMVLIKPEGLYIENETGAFIISVKKLEV